MIHLKFRREGLVVDYERVERLYQKAGLQMRRRKRKKFPVGERQPLLRPSAVTEVWSMTSCSTTPREAGWSSA